MTAGKLKKLQLDAASSLLNSHFVFNSLNVIQKFINSGETDLANRYLSKFSTLLRISIRMARNQLTLLRDELHHLDLYLSFEKLRFEHFDFTIDIDSSAVIEEYQIPSNIVRPLVESLIWNGIPSSTCKGLLKISFLRCNEKTVVVDITFKGSEAIKWESVAPVFDSISNKINELEKQFRVPLEFSHVPEVATDPGSVMICSFKLPLI